MTKWDPEKYWNHLVEEQKKYRIIHGIDSTQHILPDSAIGLELGFGGLLAKIGKYRKVNRGEDQQAYYDGLEQFVVGVQHWIANHVRDARKMAVGEENPQWRANLEEMAEKLV